MPILTAFNPDDMFYNIRNVADTDGLRTGTRHVPNDVLHVLLPFMSVSSLACLASFKMFGAGFPSLQKGHFHWIPVSCFLPVHATGDEPDAVYLQPVQKGCTAPIPYHDACVFGDIAVVMFLRNTYHRCQYMNMQPPHILGMLATDK